MVKPFHYGEFIHHESLTQSFCAHPVQLSKPKSLVSVQIVQGCIGLRTIWCSNLWLGHIETFTYCIYQKTRNTRDHGNNAYLGH